MSRVADCHASGAVNAFAMVAIGEQEPLALCRHCLTKHAPELFRLGAVVERLAGGTADDCDTLVVRT